MKLEICVKFGLGDKMKKIEIKEYDGYDLDEALKNAEDTDILHEKKIKSKKKKSVNGKKKKTTTKKDI